MVLIVTLLIFVTIVVLYILTQFPEFCIFGSCFNIMPTSLGTQLNFWLLFIAWIALQAFLIFMYIKFGTWLVRSVSKGKELFNRSLNWVRDLFNTI